MNRLRMLLRYSRFGIAWRVFRGQPAIIGLGFLKLGQSLDGVLIVDTTCEVDWSDGFSITNCELVRTKGSDVVLAEIDVSA